MKDITDKFNYLRTLDVSEKTEKRKSTDGSNIELTYLSWSYAWSEFKTVYPDATYEIKKFINKEGVLVPYMYDENTGYMCMTEVEADGLRYEMWLPVMNSVNKAMKSQSYTYTTKKGVEKSVEAATMFDVNKTIMRCLVKNLAMFGLGLYIYAGEDLPEKITDPSKTVEMIKAEEVQKSIEIIDLINDCTCDEDLRKIYHENKKQITSSKELLDLIAKKGATFKGAA